MTALDCRPTVPSRDDVEEFQSIENEVLVFGEHVIPVEPMAGEMPDLMDISRGETYGVLGEVAQNVVGMTDSRSGMGGGGSIRVAGSLGLTNHNETANSVARGLAGRAPVTAAADVVDRPEKDTMDAYNEAWTVRRLLHDIGFEHDKRERNSRLIEREDIVAWQQKYLHEIARHRQDGRKIFYLDETWVTAGHTVSKVWVDTTVASSHDAFMRGLSTGLKQPSGKGQRLIVTHIGSDEGFVDGCLDVFRGQKTGDYHEEMDGARFEKWFDGVLDKLPTGSVIVMDNASYHSRRLEAVPTTSSRKDDIRQWLTSKKISWDPKMVKKQLLDIVALVKPQHLKYCVDTAAETAGCTVVRLPPYHCEFNPIELIWAQIKNGVAARNTTFKIVDVGRLLNEEVDKVTTDNWINAVRHVIDIEATFRRGGATSAHIQPIVIQLDGEDTPSESDLSGVEPLDEA
ncbi:uncharacterized protein ISCGN_023887 [Ixodes scapularis]